MLSPIDMLVVGAAALILFGPDQLPKVARRAGQVMREVQNTSQSFIREMERAADDIDLRERTAAASAPPPAGAVPEIESAEHDAPHDTPHHEAELPEAPAHPAL